MNKKPFLIVPMILILNSIVLSIHSLYAGPSRYALPVFNAVWIQFFTLFTLIFIATRVKAKYWRVSVIVLGLAGLPRTFVNHIPAYTHILVSATLILDVISATALYAAFRYDMFDFSLLESGNWSRSATWLFVIGTSIFVAGLFLSFK